MPDISTIFSVIIGYAAFRLCWWWGKKYLDYMKQQRERNPYKIEPQENKIENLPTVENYGKRTWYRGGYRLYGGDPELVTRLEKKLKDAAEDQDRQE